MPEAEPAIRDIDLDDILYEMRSIRACLGTLIGNERVAEYGYIELCQSHWRLEREIELTVKHLGDIIKKLLEGGAKDYEAQLTYEEAES